MTDLERVREGIECVVTEGTYKVAHERHRAEALADLDAHLKEDAERDSALTYWRTLARTRAKALNKAEAELTELIEETARLQELVADGLVVKMNLEAELDRLREVADRQAVSLMKEIDEKDDELARLREQADKDGTERYVMNEQIWALTKKRDTLLAALRADLLDAENACRPNAHVAVLLSNILSRARAAIAEVEGSS